MSTNGDMKKQVEERIAAEKAARKKSQKPDSSMSKKNGSKKTGTKDESRVNEVASKFVMECLAAEQLGDGMLYAALHKGKIVYAKNSGQWYLWDKHTWSRDDLDYAISAVENVGMRYSAEIKVLEQKIEEKKGDDEGYKWAKKVYGAKINWIKSRIKSLRKDQGRKNCLKFAHTNPVNQLAITGIEFDMDPWLLGCQNGVVNLKTGELEAGDPSDYIKKRCSADFLGIKEQSSIWSDTLKAIYKEDEELVSFIQRLFGYGLTGLAIEHVFPVLIGRGRNGKSILVEAISSTMGDYAGAVPAEMLLDTNRPTNAAQSDPALMALKGMRLAIASETDEGRKFSVAKVQWLTGGDTITARGLYDKHPTQFKPSHLLILLTNHEPGAPVSSMAFWERCYLIRHMLSFVRRKPEKDYEREADTKLPGALEEIQSSILSWLVQGCLDWQDKGLAPPESVKKSTEEYRQEEDYIEQFLDAACVKESGARVGATPLYDGFVIWYREVVNSKTRFTPSQKMFGTKLKAREEFRVGSSNGKTIYHDLRLNAEYAGKSMESEGLDGGQ